MTMKKYYLWLVVLTLVLVVAAFCTLWFGQGLFQPVFAAIPLYFAVVTGLQHYAVVKSFYKDPRTFVKNFLGLTVGCLFLHLLVLCLWAFFHIPTARPFIMAFGIGYILYLLYETLALILLVKSKR